MPTKTFTVVKIQDMQVLQIIGEINQDVGAEVKREALKLIKDGAKKVLFDLSGVQAVHSAGLGHLILCVSLADRAGGKIRFCKAQGPVAQLIEFAGLADLIRIYPDERRVEWN